MSYFIIQEDKIYECSADTKGALYIDSNELIALLDAQDWTPNRKNLDYLKKTDWKIMRHRDQLELGVDTSITQEDYIQLLQLRQKWRDDYES